MDQAMDKEPLTFVPKVTKKPNWITNWVILVLLLIIFCYVLFVTSNYFNYDNENQPQRTNDKCFCRWRQKYFNVCYKMPFSPHLEGEPFSCSHLPIMKNLNLLEVYQNTTPSNNAPTIVTAFSSTYFIKGLNMISEYRKIVPRDKIVVYDIGLTKNESRFLSNICNVVLEKFDFNKYPKYVKILTQYRWKPIIITLALQKFGTIIYVDSSVHFRNTNYLRISSVANCKSQGNSMRCTHSPYMLNSYTGHTIYYATMPSVYRFIPTIKEAMQTTDMYEAGLIYVTPTKETYELLKWSVNCALEEYCIIPYHAPLHDCQKIADSIIPTCHRFDQSVINILLFNANKYAVNNYTSGITDFFSIRRDDRRKPNFELLKAC